MKGDIDPAILGNIFHEVVKRLYAPYVGKTVSASVFEAVRMDREYLNGLVNTTVNELFQTNSDSYSALNELITRNVITTYVSRVLEIDEKSAPLEIIALEKPVQKPRTACGNP